MTRSTLGTKWIHSPPTCITKQLGFGTRANQKEDLIIHFFEQHCSALRLATDVPGSGLSSAPATHRPLRARCSCKANRDFSSICSGSSRQPRVHHIINTDLFNPILSLRLDVSGPNVLCNRAMTSAILSMQLRAKRAMMYAWAF